MRTQLWGHPEAREAHCPLTTSQAGLRPKEQRPQEVGNGELKSLILLAALLGLALMS